MGKKGGGQGKGKGNEGGSSSSSYWANLRSLDFKGKNGKGKGKGKSKAKGKDWKALKQKFKKKRDADKEKEDRRTKNVDESDSDEECFWGASWDTIAAAKERKENTPKVVPAEQGPSRKARAQRRRRQRQLVAKKIEAGPGVVTQDSPIIGPAIIGPATKPESIAAIADAAEESSPAVKQKKRKIGLKKKIKKRVHKAA